MGELGDLLTQCFGRRGPRGAGCPVVACAPYSSQIRDLSMWQQLVEELGGPDVHLVWVRCDPAVLRARIEGREPPRDRGKLLRYDDFVAAVKPDAPPVVPHHTMDNSDGGFDELTAKAKRAAASFA